MSFPSASFPSCGNSRPSLLRRRHATGDGQVPQKEGTDFGTFSLICRVSRLDGHHSDVGFRLAVGAVIDRVYRRQREPATVLPSNSIYESEIHRDRGCYIDRLLIQQVGLIPPLFNGINCSVNQLGICGAGGIRHNG